VSTHCTLLLLYYLLEPVERTARAGDNRHRFMSNMVSSRSDPGQPVVYQIRLGGRLGPQWTDWFGGLTISLAENGDTLLTGPVVDQAALYGLLKKVRDLGMPLLSVNRVEAKQADAPEVSSRRREK
jgi:hypothetical protein